MCPIPLLGRCARSGCAPCGLATGSIVPRPLQESARRGHRNAPRRPASGRSAGAVRSSDLACSRIAVRRRPLSRARATESAPCAGPTTNPGTAGKLDPTPRSPAEAVSPISDSPRAGKNRMTTRQAPPGRRQHRAHSHGDNCVPPPVTCDKLLSGSLVALQSPRRCAAAGLRARGSQSGERPYAPSALGRAIMRSNENPHAHWANPHRASRG